MVRAGRGSIPQMENYQSRGPEVGGNQALFEGERETNVVGTQVTREGNIMLVF